MPGYPVPCCDRLCAGPQYSMLVAGAEAVIGQGSLWKGQCSTTFRPAFPGSDGRQTHGVLASPCGRTKTCGTGEGGWPVSVYCSGPDGPLHLSDQVGPVASLPCCESWRRCGCASGLVTATVRRKQCPRRWAPSSRSKFFALPVLHAVAAAARCGPPDPRRSDHNKDAMGATLATRKEYTSWPISAPSPQRKTASPAPCAP